MKDQVKQANKLELKTISLTAMLLLSLLGSTFVLAFAQSSSSLGYADSGITQPNEAPPTPVAGTW